MAAASPRIAPTSAKRAEVEARVLEATEALLAEGAAFNDLPIERIASRAGISRPAFYFYFRDRRELLMRLTEDVAELLYAEADAWWSGAGDGRAELARALEQVVALYSRHATLLRAVVEAAAVDETVAGFWRALVGRFVDASRARIEAEQAAGRAGALPAGEVAFALAWMTERTCYQRIVAGLDPADPQLVAGLVRVWSAAVYGG